MLKKLKIKFVLINLSMVSAMLIIIFGMVYYFTVKNLETENISMMRSIASNPFAVSPPDDSSSSLKLPFFVLQLDMNGELVSASGGYYDLSDSQFLNDLISETSQEVKETGILQEYSLRYCRTKVPMGTVLVFSDISSEKKTLTGLLHTLVIIGCLSFFLFLGISILLARWAVRPVAKAWKQQKQFIADASHELKTPLTVIMTNAELLTCPDYTEEDHSRFLQSISLMSVQMKQLIDKMLLLAKSDKQEASFQMCPFHFSKSVSDCTISFEGVFLEKGLLLEDFIEPDIFVCGNEENLRQVIDILLDNAQKYSCENGICRISLTRISQKKCRLKVSTQGAALSPEECQNIFQRFYRTDQSRSHNGSYGLGLSIAQNIITIHKGRIWAESHNGINSFFVELKTIAYP